MAHPQTSPADVGAIFPAAAPGRIGRPDEVERLMTDVSLLGAPVGTRLIPGFDAMPAAAAAERYRRLGSDRARIHEGSAAEILTTSAGVATIVACENRDRVDFMATVDKRLYPSKLEGSNRLVGRLAMIESGVAPGRRAAG